MKTPLPKLFQWWTLAALTLISCKENDSESNEQANALRQENLQLEAQIEALRVQKTEQNERLNQALQKREKFEEKATLQLEKLKSIVAEIDKNQSEIEDGEAFQLEFIDEVMRVEFEFKKFLKQSRLRLAEVHEIYQNIQEINLEGTDPHFGFPKQLSDEIEDLITKAKEIEAVVEDLSK